MDKLENLPSWLEVQENSDVSYRDSILNNRSTLEQILNSDPVYLKAQENKELDVILGFWHNTMSILEYELFIKKYDLEDSTDEEGGIEFDESIPNLINIDASRLGQIENDEDSNKIDIQKIAKYIDKNQEFKLNKDYSLTLPNGTTIVSKRKSNALTKSETNGKSIIRKWHGFSGTGIETEVISFNDLEPIVKSRGGSLETDEYRAILGGKEERQKLLIDGNFPGNFNRREKEASLLYAAQQLYGISHINGNSLKVLVLTQNWLFRGVGDDIDKDNIYGLIWIKKR